MGHLVLDILSSLIPCTRRIRDLWILGWYHNRPFPTLAPSAPIRREEIRLLPHLWGNSFSITRLAGPKRHWRGGRCLYRRPLAGACVSLRDGCIQQIDSEAAADEFAGRCIGAWFQWRGSGPFLHRAIGTTSGDLGLTPYLYRPVCWDGRLLDWFAKGREEEGVI